MLDPDKQLALHTFGDSIGPACTAWYPGAVVLDVIDANPHPVECDRTRWMNTKSSQSMTGADLEGSVLV